MPQDTAFSAQSVRDFLTSSDFDQTLVFEALSESLRQFESLLSCVSGTFYRCELSRPWKMEFISPGVEAITGYAPEFFAEHSYEDILDPRDVPALDVRIKQAISRGEHFTDCYRLRHKSGETRWVSETGRAVCDAEGRPLFLEGFISDVTEKKALELQAEESRQEIERLHARMSNIVESSLDGIVTLDSGWNYVFVNNAALRETGQSRTLVGRNARKIFRKLADAECWTEVERAMVERTPVRTECHPLGTDRCYELYAVPDGDGLTIFFKNITHRKRFERKLVDQADDLRRTLDSIPDMVWSADADGIIDYFNKSWAEYVGLTKEEFDTDFTELTVRYFHPDDRELVGECWRQSIETGRDFEIEFRVLHCSGEYRWAFARAQPQRDEQGAIVRWYGTSTDIHERVLAEHKLRESQIVQSSILGASTDSIKIMDLDGAILLINTPGMTAQGAVDRSVLVGKRWADMWPGKYRLAARRAVKKARNGQAARFTGNYPLNGKNATWWDVVVSPIRDTDGTIQSLLCISRDITEQRKTAERLRIASECDFLTSLPNRRAFEAHLKKVTARARDSGKSVGLMLLDLDHFKHVNDTLGHLAGDHLLQMLARRLKKCVSEPGFVARLGGDEFAIILDDIRDESELINGATQILARMEEPVTFAGRLIYGGLSIGSAVFPRDAENAQDLLKHADAALYDLKASGRGGIQMFSSQMMEAAERSASQLTLARRVVQDDAVEPYYQPKVRLDTGEVAGFEALLRWWCPGNGIQPPSSVFEAFNDYELATKIGGLMQDRIFEHMAGWLDAGLDLPPVSINAAPAEFARDDYGERLLGNLAKHAIAPSQIELEITEHVFLHRRSEQVVRALQMLSESGIRIALDDFGTGHSSLSYLRDFPVDVIKIDRSFVSRMLTNRTMSAIVEAITKLGPSLSLEIVAEGVETPEQLHALRDAGCDLGQGYLFGKAMHADEIAWRLGSGSWPFKLKK
ncbi:MAG: EAL domain-containing protein [Novosphingobium sp.]|nr:EAL domain-containing protein [Novosphingobium sp.]MCP5403952.1 EAL domain-containing protein [Novosphingobium sp.]